MTIRVAQVATTDVSVKYLLRGQIEGLTAAGYEVEAVCAPGPHVEELRAGGMVVRTVAMERELHPRRDLLALGELVRLFSERRYHVVLTHTPKAGLLGPLAAQIAGVPVVVHTVHGFLFHDRMPWPRRAAGMMAEVFTARFCDRLFFQSAEDLDRAPRVLLRRRATLLHVGNGIDTRRFDAVDLERRTRVRQQLGIPPETLVVGTVGRLVWEKGYAELLAAARQVRGRHPEVLFVAAGGHEPDQRDGLTEAEVEAVGARGDMRFLGHWDDMPSLYAALDLFVLASHREGIPRSLMEASASGLPVIATDIRGCREVVDDGETGLLVEVRSPRELAERIEQLLFDPARRRRMGSAGRRRIVATFDERAVVDRVVDGVLHATRARAVTAPAGSNGTGTMPTPGAAHRNALTIDVEDWRQLVHRKLTGEEMTPSASVVEETMLALELLAARDVHATFFVLGNVATAYPDLIRTIAAAGHEVASHGLSHTPVHHQTPAEFLDETRRAKDLLEDITGEPVLGYRAAEFSIVSESLWALDILSELGFHYDSSIFPIAGRRYGIPTFPPRPHAVGAPAARRLVEFPLPVVRRLGRNLPVGGGGYLRALPFSFTRSSLREINANGLPAVVYLHPYEFATLRLRPRRTALRARDLPTLLRYCALHNLGRDRLRRRFLALLETFEFVPMKELLPDVR